MLPLNYCRQISLQLRGVPTIRNFEPDGRLQVTKSDWDRWMSAAQKFILPDGGVLLDDGAEWRGLDDETPLALPFPVIALEYASPKNREFKPQVLQDKSTMLAAATKRVLLCSENGKDAIHVLPFCWFPVLRCWTCCDMFSLPTLGFRAPGPNGGNGMLVRTIHPERQDGLVGNVLLSMLNALTCSNIALETTTSARPGKTTCKSALPFDTYHILTVRTGSGSGASTGTGRSPREHLRRGHIRRLPSGGCCWVQSCVVGAGNGGHVTKDYRVG